jgi:hypothetical protein
MPHGWRGVLLFASRAGTARQTYLDVRGVQVSQVTEPVRGDKDLEPRLQPGQGESRGSMSRHDSTTA